MSASIQDIIGKLKGVLLDDVYFYTVLIVVVGILSFGLGRLSVEEGSAVMKPQAVLVAQPAASLASDAKTIDTQPQTAENSKLVASKKGTKYHLLTCPGAKQMSEENKIYFNFKIY